MHSLIKNAVNISKNKIVNKDIVFSIKISPNIPYHFSGDQLKLQQVLINIISNAAKFIGLAFAIIT